MAAVVKTNKIKECGEWIRGIQKRSGCSQENFGKKVYRYSRQEGKICCDHYSRNEVCNWINGKNRVERIETMVSLALLDYSFPSQRNELSSSDWRKQVSSDPYKIIGDLDESRRRIKHVNKYLQQFTDYQFYAKTPIDAILMSVARGIIDFEQGCEILNKMPEILSEQELQDGSANSGTDVVARDIESALDRRHLDSIIIKYRKEFLVGTAVLGQRLQKIVEDKVIPRYMRAQDIDEDEREYDVTFDSWVGIMAPRYRNDLRISRNGSKVTRKWLVNYLTDLRLNREEIDSLLHTAHYGPLSKNRQTFEGAISGENVGAFEWYQSLYESDIPDEEIVRFPKLLSIETRDKILLCILMLFYLRESDVGLLQPFDYFFESIRQISDQARQNKERFLSFAEAHTVLEQIIGNYYRDDFDVNIDAIKKKFEPLSEDIFDLKYDHELDNDESLLLTFYSGEFEEYLSLKSGKVHFSELKVNAAECERIFRRMRYFAAFSYTLFTGTYYSNKRFENAVRNFKADIAEYTEAMDWQYKAEAVMFSSVVFWFWRETLAENTAKFKEKGLVIGDEGQRVLVCYEDLIEIFCQEWLLMSM